MNVKFFHDRSIRPRDFACSATFGAAPYSTGKRKPHSQTLRKTAKISRESYKLGFAGQLEAVILRFGMD